jgi:hypothetical protein
MPTGTFIRMSERADGSSGRQFRRVRHWAKHTPNGEIALTLIMIGAVLLVAAVLLALTLL